MSVEFQQAIEYVQSKRIGQALTLLGLSPNQLIFTFAMLTAILLLLFVFIFMGISVFSLGGSFGSIINSLLPITAGVAVIKEAPANFQSQEWIRKLEEVIEDVVHIIGGEA